VDCLFFGAESSFVHVEADVTKDDILKIIRILKKSIDIIFTINYQNYYKNNNMLI
jgi:hypothetical protein